MKLCICADLHIHKYKNSYGKDRLKIGLDALEEIFKRASELDNIILCCGDILDVVPINPEVMNAVIKFFIRMEKTYPKVMMYSISGNHEISVGFTDTAEGVSALTAIHESCGNFILIDNAAYGFGNFQVWGIPYYRYKEHFSNRLDVALIPADTNIECFLLTHQTPAGIIDLEVDFDVNDPRLKRFKRVFNGHIHIHKDLGKVISVGNHTHRDKSDVDKDTGFIIYDTDSDTYTFECLSDKFPQLIVRPKGVELSDWEKQQMVIEEVEMLDTTVGNATKVSNATNPQEIVEAYVEEAGLDAETARVGRKIVNLLNS